MMVTPNQLVMVLSQPNQRQPHQGRVRQVEAALAVGLQERRPHLALFVGRKPAPIEFLPRHCHSTPDNLQRFLFSFPDKQSPQGFVPVRRLLPGALHRRPLKATGQRINYLIEIDPGVRRQQGMEKHALLQRRQRINVLDILFLFRHGGQLAPSPSSAIKLSSSC